MTLAFTDRLEIADSGGPDGAPLATWPYDAGRRVDGPGGVLRLACTAALPLARPELRGTAVRAAVLRLLYQALTLPRAKVTRDEK